ncbi:hypothetical protein F4802DRAFT_599181 [Xylaria palmicola]|nr:hypothetical protein F4802DRAFT_599181 [Xylaria palmicola]
MPGRRANAKQRENLHGRFLSIDSYKSLNPGAAAFGTTHGNGFQTLTAPTAPSGRGGRGGGPRGGGGHQVGRYSSRPGRNGEHRQHASQYSTPPMMPEMGRPFPAPYERGPGMPGQPMHQNFFPQQYQGPANMGIPSMHYPPPPSVMVTPPEDAGQLAMRPGQGNANLNRPQTPESTKLSVPAGSPYDGPHDHYITVPEDKIKKYRREHEEARGFEDTLVYFPKHMPERRGQV